MTTAGAAEVGTVEVVADEVAEEAVEAEDVVVGVVDVLPCAALEVDEVCTDVGVFLPASWAVVVGVAT